MQWAACTCGVGLVLDAGLVEIVAADGTGVGANGPRPHCHSIPLLDLEPLCWRLATARIFGNP